MDHRTGEASVARFERSPLAGWPHVHSIRLPTPWRSNSVQAYLIESDPLTLVDCGLDDRASRIALDTALEGLGYGVEDLRRLVITHYHRDHMGQAASLKSRASSLEILAHVEAAPMLEAFSLGENPNVAGVTDLFLEFGVPAEIVEGIRNWRRAVLDSEPPRCSPTVVDRRLREGDSVVFKDFALDVIHTPGHTAGHLMLHQSDSGVLWSGGQLVSGAIANTENYYTDDRPDPADPLGRRPRFRGLVEYRRSLAGLRRRSIRAILPGYGPPILQPERALREAALFYDVRIQRIERSLRSVSALGEAVSAFEIWRALFPGEDPVKEMWPHLLTVIGALDVLEEQGACITERRADGALVHRHAVRGRG
ncbi:MAG: MBL fold metallo-hydrolase [Myxococcota bacterium]|nr:MBL fold metallo-hydrolase [Myxococcota bacterium]